MITYTILTYDQELAKITNMKSVAAFLYLHLGKYRDDEEDITKSIEHAMGRTGVAGGFLVIAIENARIIGAVVMNRTGMSGFIPEKIFHLSHIEVIGLGTNLGCMHGIEPTFDKLIQLSLFEQLIETRFKQKLELVSGGSSITLALIRKGKVPKGVNHFRVGEALFIGTSPLDNKRFLNMHRETKSN